MTLKKLSLKPGINRENTRYTNENGWYVADKIRFRQGTPEKIGGWQRISTSTFIGICRSLWNWVTLTSQNMLGVGTNKKFYIELGGVYNDITPIRATTALPNNPFTAVNGSATITVNAPSHGASTGDYVTFSGAVGLGGNITAAVLNAEYEVTVTGTNAYTFTATATANAADAAGSPGGGAAVSAAYQINTGAAIQVSTSGWGASSFGFGPWGTGGTTSVASALRVWSQSNFGEDLIFGPRGGGIYYWDADTGVTSRGVLASSLTGASDVPTIQNIIFVADVSRTVFVFGCNEIGGAAIDPMLVRWSDRESVTNWTPGATNQAGFLRLSHGSEIITGTQVRQEIVLLTDASVYSLQYLGADPFWGAQLLGDNISVISQNCAVVASGVLYWMGIDKFYKYDGRVNTLNCDVLRYVYNDINLNQRLQTFAGTSEGFNEVWWFYCSEDSTVIDRYVIYNYAENVWAYGTLGRTAWLDSGLRPFPHAATYNNNIVAHEFGIDDNETGTTAAINAYVESAEFDLDDGDKFGFVRRVLPDVTFENSTAESPTGTLSLIPMMNSGSGYTNPQSQGGSSNANVARTATAPIEAFTGQVYIRVRGRQLILRFESNQVGCTWQLGSPRIDVRPDGRRGG